MTIATPTNNPGAPHARAFMLEAGALESLANSFFREAPALSASTAVPVGSISAVEASSTASGHPAIAVPASPGRSFEYPVGPVAVFPVLAESPSPAAAKPVASSPYYFLDRTAFADSDFLEGLARVGAGQVRAAARKKHPQRGCSPEKSKRGRLRRN